MLQHMLQLVNNCHYLMHGLTGPNARRANSKTVNAARQSSAGKEMAWSLVSPSPVWSPDGRWIAYLKFKPRPNNEDHWIEIFNLEHGTKRVALSEPRLDGWGFLWLPDGRLLYAMDEPPPSQNSSNFWVSSIDLSTGRFVGRATRITSGDQGDGTARTHQPRQRSRPAQYRVASEKEQKLGQGFVLVSSKFIKGRKHYLAKS